MNTQLQQSERSAQKGKSEEKGTNTTHAKFNFYFSVDKTQRSLTAATDAEVSAEMTPLLNLFAYPSMPSV